MYTQKVGGIRFTRIGPLVISTSLSFKTDPDWLTLFVCGLITGGYGLLTGHILGLIYNGLTA